MGVPTGSLAHVKPGERGTSIVSGGGYAEYATANAGAVIPIPGNVTFARQ
jgi:NADPH:quinone reductase-like Zn-dependent oxidoreductase